MHVRNQREQEKALIKLESDHWRTREHIPLGFILESWRSSSGMWGGGEGRSWRDTVIIVIV